MPHSIVFIESTKIIKTIFHGNLAPGEVKQVMLENFEIAQQQQTLLFLVDCTAIEDTESFILENYEAGVFLSKIAAEFPSALKDALILPTSPKATENLRFFETVSRNRGMNVRTFLTESEAINWLLSA